MPTKQNESFNHHFVPRSVLRRFATGPRRNCVAVFDKSSGRSWSGGMTTTGSGKGYNTLVRADGERLNFEPDFDALDSGYAELGDMLTRHRSLLGVDDAVRMRLADAVVVQFLRTPIVRSTLQAIPRQLAAQMRDWGFGGHDEGQLPGDDAVRQSARDLIADRDGLRRALLAKDMILFEPAGTTRFWTSDHPVVRHSRMPLGETGFESLGVEVYLPLAADLMLGFLCPSLNGTLDESLGEGATGTISIDALRRRGTPLRVADPVVRFFNALQVEASQRFVYASNEDFELARAMLTRRPQLASNDAMLHLGRTGEPPPRPSNLPPGQWLYLESGRSCYLIPIVGADTRARVISTERPDLLVAAMTRSFTRALVFAETGRLEMLGVAIEIVSLGVPTRLRLVSSDPSLRDLDAAIARSAGGA